MSTTLLRDIPHTVSAALDEIEDSSMTLHSLNSDHAVGPFGVFDSGERASHSNQTAFLNAPTSSTSPRAVNNFEVAGQPQFETLSHVNSHDIGHIDSYDSSIDWSDSFGDLLTSSLDTMQWGDLFHWDFDLSKQSADFPAVIDESQAYKPAVEVSDHGIDGNVASGQINEQFRTTPTATEGLLWPQLNMVDQAPLLLKHFSNVVITQMGSLPINEKSAWKILNYESAIFTLSQLTTLAIDKCDIKHASLANFYAIMAASALHLSLSPGNAERQAESAEAWRSLSQDTYNAAKQHMRLSLDVECVLPRKAKYKNQLMALGAILATALLSGNHEDVRKYLTQMEWLIRCRGLVKPIISRRARLLHNVYAWMRIISESTHVLQETNHIANLLEFTGPQPSASTEQEILPPKPIHSQEANNDMMLDSFLYLEPLQVPPIVPHRTPQATSEGQLDLHLTSPLVERDGMCMQIYGVPETWLRLVSQTTRLANALDRLDPGANTNDAEAFAMVQPKASRLENAVCAFRTRFRSPRKGPNTTPHLHMVRALSGALVIFFYRRIRGIQPLMLQESVDQVIDSLHAFDRALEQHDLPGPGTAWPAFIAGAEAMSQEQRKAIDGWLKKANSKSGWKGYETSRKVLHELWQRRDGDDGNVGLPTWMDVCKSLHCWPLLC